MRQRHLLLAALLSVIGSATAASADQHRTGAVAVDTVPMAARIVGVVRDEAGRGIDGVTIVALGTSLGMAKSAATGAFELVVPAGRYVIRVLHDGYVSTFREAVRVEASVPVERTITLERKRGLLAAQPGGTEQAGDRAEPDAVPPNETAWRLRHLPRTVLREVADWTSGGTGEFEGITPTSHVGAARARSLWAAADMTGRVEVLTTNSIMAAPGWQANAGVPRGVAYLVVGAPVGRHGDWSARASVAPGAASAWTLLAEYEARADRRHAFRTGVAYSAQTLLSDSGDMTGLARAYDVRRVAGAYGYDRWALGRHTHVAYGGRLDRVDYLAEPTLTGGTLEVEQAITARASLHAQSTRHRVAPGATLFQPPVAEGVWLPPDRTFSALDGQPMTAATVDRHEIGVVWSRPTATGVAPIEVRLDRFREDVTGQAATLFDAGVETRVGHFHVARVGSVTLDGMSVGVSLGLVSHVRARVDYVVATADWHELTAPRSAAALARRLDRHGSRRVHDVSSSVEARLPATETTLNLAVRFNEGFRVLADDRSGFPARFSVEIRQPLSLAASGADAITVFLSARTLQGHARSGGFFDDLTTLSPPLRLTGGIQVRF